MAKTTSKRVYKVHDNCGRPFEVIVKSINTHNERIPSHKAVEIWRLSDDAVNKRLYKVIQFNKALVFVGNSPKIPATIACGTWGRKYRGNSILVKDLNDGAYYVIDAGISKFILPRGVKIVKYISPVGGNDVSYPYAVDNYNNVYLMVGGVVLLDGLKKDKYLPSDVGHRDMPYYPVFWKKNETPFSQFFKACSSRHHDKEDLRVLWDHDYQHYNRAYHTKEWYIQSTPTYDGVGGRRITPSEYNYFRKQYAQKYRLGRVVYKQVEPRFADGSY
jgi:hypothetical protein